MPTHAAAAQDAAAATLAEGWRGRPQWCVLAVGAGAALEFLRTWHAWQRDVQRPRLLHFVALGEPFDLPAHAPMLEPLATQLADRCWGLTPGFHRVAFERGQVLLTCCIGPPDAMLREQRLSADAVWLGASEGDFFGRDAHRVKALVRCCRRGTRVVAQRVSPAPAERLARGGFAVRPAGAGFNAVFDPAWTPRTRHADAVAPSASTSASPSPSPALVIGAGIAGAAVAASLARRGHAVRVLDASNAPAGGASGLPAGLFVPHVSADDSALSRLSRAGIRQTLQFAQDSLEAGIDWQPGGVLEVRQDAVRVLARSSDCPPLRDWGEVAGDATKAAAGLAAATSAIWHRRAGWIKPKALVRALLAQAGPRIEWHGGAKVVRLVPGARGWQAIGARDQVLAEAGCVVIAAGDGSQALVPGALPLRSLRGQLSWGIGPPPASASGARTTLPPFPVNGDGSLLPNVPLEAAGGRRCWIAGATYERDGDAAADPRRVRAADHVANFDRLRRLLPEAAGCLAPYFTAAGPLQGWAGVRCVTPDRLPVVGDIASERQPGLWLSSAMGSRGLTFALLCAELLAARMHGEPLPVEARLARMLDVRRFGGPR